MFIILMNFMSRKNAAMEDNELNKTLNSETVREIK